MSDIKKYVRCTIKNIAVLNKICAKEPHVPYHELTDKLPNDCIRIDCNTNWCINYCDECHWR